MFEASWLSGVVRYGTPKGPTARESSKLITHGESSKLNPLIVDVGGGRSGTERCDIVTLHICDVIFLRVATLATLKKNVIINSAKCPLLNPPSQHQDFFSEVTPEGWPWWPWWPSTIGRESRRPTANPMLMRGYLCASASVGADSACLAGYHMGRDHTARQDPFCLQRPACTCANQRRGGEG